MSSMSGMQEQWTMATTGVVDDMQGLRVESLGLRVGSLGLRVQSLGLHAEKNMPAIFYALTNHPVVQSALVLRDRTARQRLVLAAA